MSKTMTKRERAAARAPLRVQRRIYGREYNRVFAEAIATVNRVRGIRKQEMQSVSAIILDAMDRHVEALVAGGVPPVLEPEVEALVDRLVRLNAAVTDLDDKIEALSDFPIQTAIAAKATPDAERWERYQSNLRCILPNLDDRGAPL